MTFTVKFLSILWWLAVIVAPFAIYWFVIRPKAKWTEVATDIAGWWPRFKARFFAFRTVVVTQLGVLIIALPDTLQMLLGVPFNDVLPQPWAAFAAPSLSILIALLRGTASTPAKAPPAGEA